MAPGEPYIGQRRSYAGALCTVRYIGPLPSTKGDWLGVEWDDVTRGKHDGQYEGKRVFQCLSSSLTAASFIRPSRKNDPERTLLEAIKFKYAPSTEVTQSRSPAWATESTIEISGKVVEEVGFDKIEKQLSTLTNLKIVLVDELVVSGIAPRGSSREDIQAAQVELAKTCPNIVELDIGWSVIETWQDIVDICAPLKKLKILKASGLRLRDFGAHHLGGEGGPFRTIEELQINECLLRPAQVTQVLSSAGPHGFPGLKTLSLSLNELETFKNIQTGQELIYPSVTAVVLDKNRFTNLSSLPTLMTLFPNINTLSLQGNAISSLGLDTSATPSTQRFETLETLNLAGNQISDYSFVNALATLFPNLTSLRISRNPLYDQAESLRDDAPQSRAAPRAPVRDSTSYYLTLARIPHLKSLNYTTITPRDREEGEIFYLSVATNEIKQILDSDASSPLSPEEKVKVARQQHPLYSHLCATHDRDDVLERFLLQSKAQHNESGRAKSDLDAYAPGTLGSRLVDTYFYIPDPSTTVASVHFTTFRRHLPTTVSVYRLKSLIAKRFNLPALRFRLIYESHEYDPIEPISRSTAQGGGKQEWEAWGDWDVDDDDHDHDHDHNHGHDQPNPKSSVLAVDGNQEGTGVRSDPRILDIAPIYITRDGQRFKKRETEILDGMRPWSDFLDLDAPDGTRRRDARVRIEPFAFVPDD